MAEQEFFHLGTIVTNTIEDSTHEFFVDLDPICPNMSNKEFRRIFSDAQTEAVAMIGVRLKALEAWHSSEKDRVFQWFGCNDESIRMRLLTGLGKVLDVVRGFGPENVVRTDSEYDRATGCLPNPRGRDAEAAHVCAPDTATHTIAISLGFCTMRPRSGGGDSRVSTIIHEATHFLDTMATGDPKYGIVPMLKTWGQEHPELAIKNADSVAGYCVYSD